MGIVSEHLVGLIAKQVEERSLVVCYDPGADSKAVAERLDIPGTTVARYDGRGPWCQFSFSRKLGGK